MSAIATHKTSSKPSGPNGAGKKAEPSRESEKTPKRENKSGAGGLRLADAFDVVSVLPALSEAHDRLARASESANADPAELAEAIESDSGLTIAVMRAANNGGGPAGGCENVRRAVEILTPGGVQVVAATLETYDVLDPESPSARRTDRFRRHGVAVRDAAERVADLARVPGREQLSTAALLHDVGRLVVSELYKGFDASEDMLTTPEDRLRHERRELGIDHALVGAVLARRWALPPGRHHAPDATGLAAVIKLADLIVHHNAGAATAPGSILEAAAVLSIAPDRVRALVYEFPYAGNGRKRSSEPCPLSHREIDALRGLAEGKVYKQIAQELSLSVSTIRTHLHNVYRKIGAVDRAQAVLIARDRGWI
jgi:DNA-binding CsgD family transcriptional regulator/HD-like signal output (HDOD) protein